MDVTAWSQGLSVEVSVVSHVGSGLPRLVADRVGLADAVHGVGSARFLAVRGADRGSQPDDHPVNRRG